MRRAALAFLVLAACTNRNAAAPGPTASSTAPAPTTTAAGPATGTPPAARGLHAALVARVERPTDLAARPGDPAVYVAEKTGRVRKLVGGAVTGGAVVDVSSDLSQASEQGLLGLAFSPDGRFAYVYWTARTGDVRVGAHDMANADPADVVPVLTVPHSTYAVHNGGSLAFGPDKHLYIGVGDGGSEHDPNNTGQNLGTLLGKLLRIDPTPGGPAPYTVPADNPFAGRAGARPEIWAYGLRNPWRISFDRAGGDLWIADVGQDQWEEIDVQPAGSKGGENYGWSLREATHTEKGPRPAGNVDPIYEYSHAGGNCAITGGYVSRDTRSTGFQGAYLFADFCAGNLQVLRRSAAGVDVQPLGVHVDQVASFGQDGAGVVYVLSLAGSVFRLDPTF